VEIRCGTDVAAGGWGQAVNSTPRVGCVQGEIRWRPRGGDGRTRDEVSP